MTKKTKKGFTLTELIVVIAIIAILAAVLIPTSIKFIRDAKLSSDNQSVSSMNKLLQVEAIDKDVLYFDIYALNNFFEATDYKFSVKSKGYSIWYDRATNKLILGETDKILSEQYTISASNNFYQDQVESISNPNPSFLFLSGDEKISNTISFIRNFGNEENKSIDLFNNKLNEKMGSNNSVKDYFNKFSPIKTLYITNRDYFIDSKSSFNFVENIVFSSDINTVPKLPTFAYSNILNNNSITLPSTITFVQEGAFSNVSNKIIINCNYSKVIFDEGSVNTLIKYFNPLLKEGSKITFEECFDINYDNADIVYYYRNELNELISNTYIQNISARSSSYTFLEKPIEYEKAYLIPTIQLKNNIGNIYGVDLHRTILNNIVNYECKLYNKDNNLLAKFNKSIYFIDLGLTINEPNLENGLLNVNLPYINNSLYNYEYEKLTIILIDIDDNTKNISTIYDSSTGFNFTLTASNYNTDHSYMIRIIYNVSESKQYTIFEKKINK